MSGINNPTKTINATGDAFVDAQLLGRAWSDDTISYSAPTSRSAYDYTETRKIERKWWFDTTETISLHKHLLDGFQSISDAQLDAAHFALNAQYGPTASKGFSIEGFTDLGVVYDPTADRTSPEHVRLANTTAKVNANDTAKVADFPGGGGLKDDDGDVWFGTQTNDYTQPAAGNYAWITHLHEIGHAVGLVHGHGTDSVSNVSLPHDKDSMEYSIMTYHSHVGHPGGGYSNGWDSYAQTFMMADIAALQHMYGADFTTNGGDTVYSWTPGSGDTHVNGSVGIDAVGRKVFATIWDGGGTDTYDLSAYWSGVDIDLRPGKHSTFEDRQLARLGTDASGATVKAAGSVFNALQHEGDARSLIEDAIGGRGDDVIDGNAADNTLTGGGGADTMRGYDGDDTFLYSGTVGRRDGSDAVNGHGGEDRILLEGAGTVDLRGLNVRSVEEIEFAAKADTDMTLHLSNKETDQAHEFRAVHIDGNGTAGSDEVIHVHADYGTDVDLSGWSFKHWWANDTVRIDGSASANEIVGSREDDVIDGLAGADRIEGGGGADTLTGGSGSDTFVFADVADSSSSKRDVITDFQAGDRIDLSGIDARLSSSFDSIFTFLGDVARSVALDYGEGALWVENAAGGDTSLYGNVDRDDGIEFALTLEDEWRDAGWYAASDFIA